MGAARRPWDEVRAAPYGLRDTSVPPRWLVPARLPQRLDLARVEFVAQLQTMIERSEQRSKLPLVLVDRRTPLQYNTLHRQIVGRGRAAEPSLLVHPVDATARGLRTGDVAVITNPAGAGRDIWTKSPPTSAQGWSPFPMASMTPT